jgi:hypothetical protein
VTHLLATARRESNAIRSIDCGSRTDPPDCITISHIRYIKIAKGALSGDDCLQEELLSAMGPEARATARATFGRGLNRIRDPEEIIDVLNVSEPGVAVGLVGAHLQGVDWDPGA